MFAVVTVWKFVIPALGSRSPLYSVQGPLMQSAGWRNIVAEESLAAQEIQSMGFSQLSNSLNFGPSSCLDLSINNLTASYVLFCF